MGNVIYSSSKSTKTKKPYGIKHSDILHKMDIIAAKYITSLHLDEYDEFKSSDKCKDMVILTSDQIANTMKYADIQHMNTRISDGYDYDYRSEKTDIPRGKALYGNRSQIIKASESNQNDKRRICNGIAKFYIRIAQIYAAIVKATNPSLRIGTDLNNKYNKKVFNKGKIEFSLCGNIADNVAGKFRDEVEYGDRHANPLLKINPQFCKANLFLGDETGIMELEELFKDEYDYDTGEYKMTRDTDRYMTIYNQFYRTFTGESYSSKSDKLPRFSDIPVSKYEVCTMDNLPNESTLQPEPNVDSILNSITDPSENRSMRLLFETEKKYFTEYAMRLKKFFYRLHRDETAIMEILNQIFIFRTSYKTSEDEQVTIHPSLTVNKLERIAMDTRNLIAELYMMCQTNQSELHNSYRNIVVTREKIKQLKLSKV